MDESTDELLSELNYSLADVRSSLDELRSSFESFGSSFKSLSSLLVGLLGTIIPSGGEGDISFGLRQLRPQMANVSDYSGLANGITSAFDSILTRFDRRFQNPIIPTPATASGTSLVMSDNREVVRREAKLSDIAGLVAQPDYGVIAQSFKAILGPRLDSSQAALPSPSPATAGGKTIELVRREDGSYGVATSNSTSTPESTRSAQATFSRLSKGFESIMAGWSGALGKLPTLANGLTKAAGAFASGGGGGLGGAILGAASGAWRDVSFVTGEMENLRQQALQANALNRPLTAFSGGQFASQTLFQLGQWQRVRTLAHDTEESGSALARASNSMEDSFLPFDILKRDISNKIGTVKAYVAKGFADAFLTPIAETYNSIGRALKAGATSENRVLSAATISSSIGAGALSGAFLGSRFGVWGGIAGGLAGGAVGAFGVDPTGTARILGQAGGWASAAGLAGTILGGLGGGIAGFLSGGPGGALALGIAGAKWGGLGGGIAGGLAGGVKAAVWDEAENDKIRKGPWTDFIAKNANEKPLRPPVQVPQVPRRFQLVK